MKGIVALILVVAAPAAARAAEPAPKTDKVPPAQYRILVEYDKKTIDDIRAEIRSEVRKALEARRRRLSWSKDELESQIQKELERYKEDFEAIEHAARAEREARARGDRSEAERWERLRMERMRDARELAARARRAERALLALSRQNWRAQRRREREIAEKALVWLEATLKKVEAARKADLLERGAAVVPPHE
ncbi:MAG: hypothetical protein ABIF82_09695 [Planctomycetota bacterium]